MVARSTAKFRMVVLIACAASAAFHRLGCAARTSDSSAKQTGVLLLDQAKIVGNNAEVYTPTRNRVYDLLRVSTLGTICLSLVLTWNMLWSICIML